MATNQRSTDTTRDAGRSDRDRGRDTNPDPITGAPGSHPIGTGVGAAVGGAAGAAIGSVIPGPGTVAGGVVGAVIGAAGGGLAGKDIAEGIDPTAEDAYWRENYKTRPYYSSDYTYDEYAPAYRYGWEARTRYGGRKFDDVENELSSGWGNVKSKSRLGWEKAKYAARDAWDRVDRAVTGRSSRDRNAV